MNVLKLQCMNINTYLDIIVLWLMRVKKNFDYNYKL